MKTGHSRGNWGGKVEKGTFAPTSTQACKDWTREEEPSNEKSRLGRGRSLRIRRSREDWTLFKRELHTARTRIAARKRRLEKPKKVSDYKRGKTS